MLFFILVKKSVLIILINLIVHVRYLVLLQKLKQNERNRRVVLSNPMTNIIQVNV